jgi:hypothetical protein
MDYFPVSEILERDVLTLRTFQAKAIRAYDRLLFFRPCPVGSRTKKCEQGEDAEDGKF